MDKEYKVGDVVWYIPGYRGHCLIAVECVITEVDDYFRKKDPQAYLFYIIDEPCGHSLANYELFDSKEEALQTLKAIYDDIEEFSERVPDAQLENYREQRIEFILGTQGLVPEEIEEAKQSWLASLPVKKYNEKWFNYLSIRDSTSMPG